MEILYVILVIAVLIVTGSVHHHYRLKKIALSRGDADICKYARSFDYRNVDTKIMRAVYKKVQEWAGAYDGKQFPVQASDDFNEVYQMDPDDLNDIYWTVADELGISTEKAEENPYYNNVNSVKELVLFLHHQPKCQKA